MVIVIAIYTVETNEGQLITVIKPIIDDNGNMSRWSSEQDARTALQNALLYSAMQFVELVDP